MKSSSKLALSIMSAALLASCATKPENVAPAYISQVSFQNWTCTQLGEEAARLNAAYADLAARQTKARGNDTVGVILLGLPVSSLSGSNVADQIANVKGQQQTIAQVAILKNCSSQSAATK